MQNKKASPALLVLLAVLMVLLYLFGFYLKQTAFLGNELYKDTPIPALPYIFLFDDAYHDQLAAERFQESLDAMETEPPEPDESDPGVVEETDAESETVMTETEPSETADAPETAIPEETSAPETAAPEPPPAYVKGTADESYFDDVLFVGDSRTDGLYLYSRFEGADYFSDKGMTIFGVFDKPARDGKTMLEALLAAKSYGKIYIMLGINEVGSNLDLLVKQFAVVLDRLRELAPDAIIVMQGNLAVDEKKSAATWYLTAERIHELNSRIAELADGERVFYLDPNEIFCDEKGFLMAGLSGDGVHLYAKHYADWTAWLCENAFVKSSVN